MTSRDKLQSRVHDGWSGRVAPWPSCAHTFIAAPLFSIDVASLRVVRKFNLTVYINANFAPLQPSITGTAVEEEGRSTRDGRGTGRGWRTRKQGLGYPLNRGLLNIYQAGDSFALCRSPLSLALIIRKYSCVRGGCSSPRASQFVTLFYIDKFTPLASHRSRFRGKCERMLLCRLSKCKLFFRGVNSSP